MYQSVNIFKFRTCFVLCVYISIQTHFEFVLFLHFEFKKKEEKNKYGNWIRLFMSCELCVVFLSGDWVSILCQCSNIEASKSNEKSYCLWLLILIHNPNTNYKNNWKIGTRTTHISNLFGFLLQILYFVRCCLLTCSSYNHFQRHTWFTRFSNTFLIFVRPAYVINLLKFNKSNKTKPNNNDNKIKKKNCEITTRKQRIPSIIIIQWNTTTKIVLNVENSLFFS